MEAHRLAFVGQALCLRRALSPPGAGPRKVFGIHAKPGPNGIILDILHNPPKLRVTTHHVIEAFILPKRAAGPAKQDIGMHGGSPLQRTKQFREPDEWRCQQMDMVGHYDPCVQFVVTRRGSAVDRIDDNLCDLRFPQKHWPTSRAVQEAIHCHERLSRAQPRKRPVRRQTPVEPKRDEYRPPDRVYMWQPASSNHLLLVPRRIANSRRPGGPRDRRRARPCPPRALDCPRRALSPSVEVQSYA